MYSTPTRDQIEVGTRVLIETKKDQGTGRLTEGTVDEILTSSNSHPHGIKIRLVDGDVGRVREILGGTRDKQLRKLKSHKSAEGFAIPKVEDRHNEFKEFYQYDQSIENLPNYSKKSAVIEKIKLGAQERFATAICSFGNSWDGGYAYIGIKSDGTISGLEKDMKLGGFKNYEDDLANHMRDTLGKFLGNKAFLASNISIMFKEIDRKVICVIQIKPSNVPIYVRIGREKLFFTRGFAPRAEKLDPEEQASYIKDRFY